MSQSETEDIPLSETKRQEKKERSDYVEVKINEDDREFSVSKKWEFGVQFRALMIRNYLIKRRTCCSTFCEILLPALLLLLFTAIRSIIDIDVASESLLLDQSLIFDRTLQRTCFKMQLDFGNQHLALAPEDSPQVQQLHEFLTTWSPQVPNGTQVDFGVTDIFYDCCDGNEVACQIMDSFIPGEEKGAEEEDEQQAEEMLEIAEVPEMPEMPEIPAVVVNTSKYDGGKCDPSALDFTDVTSCNFQQAAIGIPDFAPISEDRILLFPSNQDLEDYLVSKEYGRPDQPQVFAAVILEVDEDKNRWDYTIRMNTSDNNVPATLNTPTDDTSASYDALAYSQYTMGGFLFLVDVVDTFILKQQDSDYEPGEAIFFQPFPEPDNRIDFFVDLVGIFLGLFVVLVFLWPVSRIIKILVEEKEKRIKEGMKMMGLKESALFCSWFVTYMLIFIIIAALITLETGFSVFEFSDKFYVFLLFWIFGLTAFAFSFMISSIFSRARLGSVMGALVFLLLYFGYFSVSDEDVSRGTKTISCLSSPIAFGLGLFTYVKLDSAGIGVTSEHFYTEIDNFSCNTAIGMMIFDFFFYILIGVYLERVVPSQYGINEKWYFCFSPSYWRGGRKSLEGEKDQHVEDNENFEKVDKNVAGEVGVQIRGLRKVFGDPETGVIAVKGTNLDLYKGQILALLGHNGAGKTTTINMLTGMLPATAGDAYVFGQPVSSNTSNIRKTLGVCPQHDVLYDILTVREHLRLYARIKGVAEADIEECIEHMIDQVDIREKAADFAGNLSGGQKRKLSVGIALIGGSNIIFLDEPTSGMDPYARRFTWDLIKHQKANRVIVLTTHFMDEADYLGDRIAIMSGGEMKCYGSSLFLKNRYGVGYSMTVSKTDNCVPSRITNLITDHIPDAVVLSDVAAEMSFRLPFEGSSKFPTLFDELDAEMETLRIESYGISVTTLEEVFLRVASDEADEQHKELVKKFRRRTETLSELRRSSTVDQIIAQDPAINEEKGELEKADGEELKLKEEEGEAEKGLTLEHSAKRDFVALLKKRYHNAKRDRKVWAWQCLIPFLVLIAGVGIMTVGTDFRFPDFALQLDYFNKPNIIQFAGESDFDMTELFPYILSDESLASYEGEGYLALNEDGSSITSIEDMQRHLLQNLDLSETSLVDPEWQGASQYCAYMFNPTSKNNSVEDDGDSLPPVVIFINTTSEHAVPTFLNLFAELNARSLVDDNSFEVVPHNEPLPQTAEETGTSTSIIGVMVGIAFAFVPASFLAFIVKEKATKVKHQQLVSGVNIIAYWSSTYIWDIVNYIVPAILCLIVFAIYDIEEVIGADSIGATILLLIFFITSVAPFAYLSSFLFSSHATAQSLMFFFFILSGAVLPIVSIVLEAIPSTQADNEILVYFFSLIPNFCFVYGLSQLLSSQIGQEPQEPFDWGITGRSLCFMIVESFVYFGILILIEKIQSTPSLLIKFSKSEPAVPHEQIGEIDEDVQTEEERLMGEDGDDEMIQLKKLRKVYPGRYGSPPKIAVKDLSFGIPKGQVFGFLGINGAGKTTTLKMLTADILATSGEAYLAGHNIKSEQQLIRRHIGYCPQFDALLDTLTAREHLIMFATIKGIPQDRVEEYADTMINKIGLTEYADRPSKGYSGGNKRKLSVGIALIGNPKIVFLDEPSTGMDPQSRRFMWNLISSTMQNRSVILTTHSMDECQALCDRIGIMVSGQLQCIGSIPHIKHRFASGYQLDVNVTGDEQQIRVVDEFVMENFESPAMLESHGGSLKYRIGHQKQTLGEIFRIIENARDDLCVAEYSVSETTLEQIFLRFARKQEELDRAEEAIRMKYQDAHDRRALCACPWQNNSPQ